MDDKSFPVLFQGDKEYLQKLTDLKCPKFILWSLIEPHEAQAQLNHSQTLARLSERGGLDPQELLAVLLDKPYRDIVSYWSLDRVVVKINELIKEKS